MPRIVNFFARASSRLRARSNAPVALIDHVPEEEADAGAEAGGFTEGAGGTSAVDGAAEPIEEPAEDPYEIVEVDLAALTPDLANRLAMLDRAELIAAGRDVAAVSGPALLTKLRTLSSGLWVAGPRGRALARPVGWVTLTGGSGEEPTPESGADAPADAEDPEYAEDAAAAGDGVDGATLEPGDVVAVVHGSVATEQRATGLGRELLSLAIARAAERGHRVVAATVWEASEAEEFLWRRGFGERAAPSTVRRIELGATAQRRRRITEDALSYGASYQLLRESEDVEGTTVFRIRARHLINGAPAGTAQLSVADAAPEHAVNGDVLVEPAHRGNRLGLLMLSDLLSWIEVDRPRVRVAQSSVPVSATHVVGILDRLGSRIAGVQVELRRRLH
ncbi:GNAT family N-acetyltransferase [Nocardioides sp. Iso805N]|uniref:GNAT family N-acetyltransferase n=1 Tax=Nocardioides sp. Iso805N TaxID=1283287 RepID=UPI000377E704|nr:GNAT family N-acetyltransferase [Nocardioides sp. Iso805N]